MIVALCVAPARAADIQVVTSQGGVTAWLIEDHANPLITVDIAFRGGSVYDPGGREGVANMVSGLLDEGAGGLDSRTFQTRLEDLQIQLRFDAGRDDFDGSLRTLSKNRDVAFDLLRLALTAPRFDAEPVERIRGQILSGLLRSQDDPDTIANLAWYATMFPGHPYGRPSDGTVETVRAIEIADLKAHVARHLVRDDMIVSVVGDIDAATLAPLLDSTFGALPAGEPRPVPAADPFAGGMETVIERPVPQTVINFGLPGIQRDDPDWYAAYVMNYVLGGGGFTSRLTEEVREKRGLAYSVYSYLYPMDHAGLWVGGVSTQNARAGESVQVIRDELARLREDGVTADELANAKAYLNGSFPLNLTSSARIAGLLTAIQRNDLGLDYMDRRAGLIDSVTLDDVQRVAKRLIDPAKLLVIAVGRPVGLGG
ncbi:MAG: pitrilysin family protein [Alphaproteobacteria bacterium]